MSSPVITHYLPTAGKSNSFRAFQPVSHAGRQEQPAGISPVSSLNASIVRHQHSEAISFAHPLKHLAEAGGLLGVALLLHRLPARPSSFSLLSSDWKDWARLGLGVKAVDEVNKAGQWKPAPWLLALQTVTVLAPLTHGVMNPKSWKQLPLLAAVVPALVQGTHWATAWANKTLDDQHSKIPRWIPNIVIPLASTVAGIGLLRSVVKTPAYQRFTGQEEAGHATSTVIGSEAVICGRCGGTHLICMSELADMGASMWASIRHKLLGMPSPQSRNTSSLPTQT